MEKNTLAAYLEQIFNLEKSVLVQQNYMEKVNQLYYDVNNTEIYRENEKKRGTSGKEVYIIMSCALIAGLVLAMIVLVFWTFSGHDSEYYPKIIFASVAFSFVCGGIYLSKEGKEVENENKAIEEKNKYIRLENEKIEKWKKEESKTLQDEYKLLSEKLEETKKILEQLYNINIIFPKYRNIIAISSFYEYLMAGRCTELEGAEGAYNIFESELRMNLIINKIDDVIRHLEQIEQHQYMLYSAIQENNKQVLELNGELIKLVNNSACIEENTKMTEYYSWISARNTEAIKWKELGLIK